MKKLFWLLVIFTACPIIAFANGCEDWHVGGWRHMLWFGFGGMFMWILFLILAAVVIYLVWKSTQSKVIDTSYRETPTEILKKRYAKGEITKEEFDEMKRNLQD